MGNTFKRFAALFFFLLIGVFLFSSVSEVLRKKSGGQSDMIHSFYGIEENTLDVLCMGSSHGYSSFQPNTLWNEYGLTSYVMCSQRQTMASTYYLLQEVLKYQRPRVLLLESYYLFCKKKYTDEAALRMGFDGTKMSRIKYEMVEDILGRKGLKEKLTYYIPFLKYHSRWTELKNLDFHSKQFLKGSIFDFGVFPIEEPELPQTADGAEIPKNSETYLNKIIDLCEDNDIELVMYTAPYSWVGKQDTFFNKQKISLVLEAYLKELEIPYICFQRSDVAGIDYASDFRDHAHLNTNGAIKITRYLGKYLTEEYRMEDHRGDEAYARWEADYEEFEQAMNEAVSG